MGAVGKACHLSNFSMPKSTVQLPNILDIEVTSWLVSADDFSSRVARGANERVSAANE